MYPIMVNLENKRVVIIGGGKVATQKTEKLLQQKAKIVVISPEITDKLNTYAVNGEIEWVKRPFKEGDTENAFLVIAATNEHHVNEQVKDGCLDNQLINVVDSPIDSNFFNMAYLDHGMLKIAISTEGASPLLAKQIKQDIMSFLDDSYDDYLLFLQKARQKIKTNVLDEKRKLFLLHELLQDRFRKNEVERELFLENLF